MSTGTKRSAPGSVSSSEAPGLVSRLVDNLRTRGGDTRTRETFQQFESKVLKESAPPGVGGVRISCFYDEDILPRGSALATPRNSQLVDGLSTLEILFEFFAGRQQPGTCGCSSKLTFDEIAQGNVSMSFPELLKFASMMFPKDPFTRVEIQWMMTKAKTERYAEVEGNWHGDDGNDIKQMNFLEFLSCVVRMSLIAFGSKGLTPKEGIHKTSKLLMLSDPLGLKARLLRVARTNGGFGGWKEPTERPEEGASISINQKRPKPIQDFMLSRPEMMDMQHLLLSYCHKPSTTVWKPFDGSFVSMVVPVTPEGVHHKFQILLQSTSQKPVFPACDLSQLPFASTRYLPASDNGLAAGMESTFDVFCATPSEGEYTGVVTFSDTRSGAPLGRVQVYIRAVPCNEQNRSRALSAARVSATNTPPEEKQQKLAPTPAELEAAIAGEGGGTRVRGLLGRSGSAMSLCSATGKLVNPNKQGQLKEVVAPINVKAPKGSYAPPMVHPTQRKPKGASLMRQTDLAPLQQRQ